MLSYSEKTTIEQGIEKMFEWAKRQPRRMQYKWPAYEVSKGIYSYWK